jgi:hypothetical protein
MAQAISRRPLTAEAWVRTYISPYGICGGQSGNGTGFFPDFFGFPLSTSFHRGSPNSYHLEDEQQARCWQQFRDMVSPHRHEQVYVPSASTTIDFAFRPVCINGFRMILRTNSDYFLK